MSTCQQEAMLLVNFWQVLRWNPKATTLPTRGAQHGWVLGLLHGEIHINCMIFSVDGRNSAPVEVGSLCHFFLRGSFIHPRWLFGISSINSSSCTFSFKCLNVDTWEFEQLSRPNRWRGGLRWACDPEEETTKLETGAPFPSEMYFMTPTLNPTIWII